VLHEEEIHESRDVALLDPSSRPLRDHEIH
jgi:hypothetical protein